MPFDFVFCACVISSIIFGAQFLFHYLFIFFPLRLFIHIQKRKQNKAKNIAFLLVADDSTVNNKHKKKQTEVNNILTK